MEVGLTGEEPPLESKDSVRASGERSQLCTAESSDEEERRRVALAAAVELAAMRASSWLALGIAGSGSPFGCLLSLTREQRCWYAMKCIKRRL